MNNKVKFLILKKQVSIAGNLSHVTHYIASRLVSNINIAYQMKEKEGK